MSLSQSESASETPLHPVRVLIEMRLKKAVRNAIMNYGAAACLMLSTVYVYEWRDVNIGIIALLSPMVITPGGVLLVAE